MKTLKERVKMILPVRVFLQTEVGFYKNTNDTINVHFIPG